MEAAINSEKERFRRDTRALRQRYVAALTPSARVAQEAAIAERVAVFLENAAIIASYFPMGYEVNPAACIAIAPEGARTALPWFESRDAPMLFRDAVPPLEPGPFGTMQPRAAADLLTPDTILVPLVAADIAGNRIGQGKGHFDRTLATLRERTSVVAIGLAWDEQIFDQLPADGWDQRLDAVVTPTRIIRP